MTRHRVSDLIAHVQATHQAGIAFCAMHEATHGDAAILDRLHREALAAVHRQHAALATLGIDPLCPHPVRMAEVYAQEDAAKVSMFHIRKQAKKERTNAH